MSRHSLEASEFRFFTAPGANVKCRIAEAGGTIDLQLHGNRKGLLSLANVLFWLMSNGFRREFLSLRELDFVELEDGLSVYMRLVAEEKPELHGRIDRIDQGYQYEWSIGDEGLMRISLLIHHLVAVPEHEYDRLITGSNCGCGIEIRMTDANDWIVKTNT